MARIRLPKDPSCCPTCAFITVFCGECPTPGSDAEQQQHSQKITQYEAMIGMIRQPCRSFRAPASATRSEATGYHKGMTTYLMTHFQSRYSEGNDGKRNYRYELFVPAISSNYISVCKVAWMALHGIGEEKLAYVFRQSKDGETPEARIINAAGDKEQMSLKDAYAVFGLDYEDSWKYHEAYVDLEQVGDSTRMMVAAVWIADEVISVGDNEVRCSTIIQNSLRTPHVFPCSFLYVINIQPNELAFSIDPVDIKDLFKEYQEERCVKNLVGETPLSYPEFASLFKRAFKHVHIREYKNVSGKCDICERLKSMFRSFKLPQDRETLRAYRSMHRYEHFHHLFLSYPLSHIRYCF